MDSNLKETFSYFFMKKMDGILIRISLKFCSAGFDWPQVCIGLGKYLASKRHQAIISSSDHQVLCSPYHKGVILWNINFYLVLHNVLAVKQCKLLWKLTSCLNAKFVVTVTQEVVMTTNSEAASVDNIGFSENDLASLMVVFEIKETKNMLQVYTGLILGLRPANERQRYIVTTSLIGWTQT